MSAETLGIDVSFEEGYLLIRTVGPIDDRTWPSLLTAFGTAAKKHQCSRFFLDHRASKLRLGMTDIYKMPADLRQHGIDGHRSALVFSDVGESERFLEDVCANRGVHVKVFTDTDRALAWLMGAGA